MKIKIESDSVNITTSLGNSYDFKFFSKIEPQKNKETIKEIVFESVPENDRNEYGNGSFCSFNVDFGSISEGVYILCLDNEIQYIGESKNLNRQFNNGFGRIEEINITQKGRSTNCKINHAVLAKAKNGKFFDIYVFETQKHKEVKKEILLDFVNTNKKPKYNEKC